MNAKRRIRFAPRISLRMFLFACVAASLSIWWWVTPTPTKRDLPLPGGVWIIQNYKVIPADGGAPPYELAHGPYAVRDRRDRLVVNGKMVDGLPSGRWTYFYDNGRRRSLGSLVNGQRTGEWTVWHESGRVAEAVTFDSVNFEVSSGKGFVSIMRNGLTQATWPNGNRRFTGHYHDDLPDGEWQYWDRDGRLLAAGSFRDGNAHGPWRRRDDRSGEIVESFLIGGLPTPPHEQLLDDLEQLLRHGRPGERVGAIETLAMFRPDGVRRIVAALNTLDADSRFAAFDRLRLLGPDSRDVCKPLEQWTHSDDPDTRIAALMAWRSIVPKESAESLKTALLAASDSDRAVRYRLLSRIAKSRTDFQPDGLLLDMDQLLTSKFDPEVHRAILELLAVIAARDTNHYRVKSPDRSADAVREFLRERRDAWPEPTRSHVDQLLERLEQFGDRGLISLVPVVG